MAGGQPDWTDVTATGSKGEVSASEAKAKCEERIAEVESILGSKRRLKKHDKEKLEHNLQKDKAQLRRFEQYRAIAQRSLKIRATVAASPAETGAPEAPDEAEDPEQLQARMA